MLVSGAGLNRRSGFHPTRKTYGDQPRFFSALIIGCADTIPIWSWERESNSRRQRFQCCALPTELPHDMAGMTGLEPALSGSTDRRFNQLSYMPKCLVPVAGFEPATSTL